MGDDSKQPDLAAAQEGPVGLYELFIAVLTIMSLGVTAVLLLLPDDAMVQEVLIGVDGLFCAILS